MPPTGGNTGCRNFKLTVRFGQWAEGNAQGEAFDSSTGFRLPNGSVRSPDVSWVSKAKLETLTHEQMEKYPPLCPDFVLELRSPTDRLDVVKEKMQEYMENGGRIGLAHRAYRAKGLRLYIW